MKRDRKHNVDGRLFQAKMWREYAQVFNGQPNRLGYTPEYVRDVLGHTREDCIRRARLNLYLAHRLNRG